MNKLSNISQRLSIISGLDFYSFFIFAVVGMFQVASWGRFPLFLDCYYHLSVVRGFHDAGGWVGTAFWEYAPFGRPHLYPPLIHILELSVYKLGYELISVARLFDFLIYPIFLFGTWFVIRRTFSASLAFFNLFLIFSSYSLYLSIINNIPFSLAFLFGFFTFYFFEQRRLLSAFLSLTFAFYSHSLVPWLFILALFLYVFFDRQGMKFLLKIVFCAFLAASPLLYHQLKFISFVRFVKVPDFYFAQVSPLLCILALMGLWLAFQKKGRYRFMIALTLSLIFLFVTHRHRLFSGQGLIPLCFFGAIVLDDAWKQLFLKQSRLWRVLFWCGSIFLFHFFSMWILSSPFTQGHSMIRGDSPLANWLGLSREYQTCEDVSVYDGERVHEIVRLIEANSKGGDIIFSNYNYAGGMLALFAHRATSNAMLAEVRPFQPFDEIAYARLILWFKEPSGEFPKGLSFVIKKYGLKKIGETELVYLYLNEKSYFRRKMIPAQLPFRFCLSVFLFAFFAIVFESLTKIKVDIP